MRVFPPEAHRKLTHVLDGWVNAARLYGFLQYKTPLIDPMDLYTDKTSEEIMREQTYHFTDRGNRSVVLRPEITPGACSLVLGLQRNRVLRSPFKGFTIGSVFRYENTQKGRSREHIQFNADIFGEREPWADAEVIAVIFAALANIGFRKNDFTVRINDRRAVTSALTDLGVPRESLPQVLRLLDRREKQDSGVFETELRKYAAVSVNAMDDVLRNVPDSVTRVMNLLPEDIPAVYDPGIIRGFDYYTGIVFEVFTTDRSVAPRSVAGGGRYDTLIESYGGSPFPAVGFGMGDVVLLDCLDAFSVPVPQSEISLVIYTTTDSDEAYRRSGDVRKRLPASFIGLVSEKKVSEVYKRGEAEGARYAVGIDAGVFTVRDLRTRKTATVSSVGAALTAMRPSSPGI